MSHRHVLAPITTALAILALLTGCSSDDPSASSSGSAEQEVAAVPTICDPDPVDDRPTVTIDVDDDSDGASRFGTRTPNPLPAGPVRLVLDAVAENAEPVSVAVTAGTSTVFEFVQVDPGVQCAADLELAAGDYTVTFGDSSKTFTVTP